MISLMIRNVTALLLLSVCMCASAAIKFPELTGRVVDNAGMISSYDAQKIARKLEHHEQTTSNQIVVVTVENLQGYSVEEFGYQLWREWAIGQKGKDNGVLLLVAKQDRKIRIEVGYGLEGSLTDAIAGNIIRTKISPAFKRGQFGTGITAGVDGIISAISGTYNVELQKASSHAGDRFGWLLVVGGFVLFLILSIWGPGGGSSRHRRYGGYGGGSFGGGGGGFSGGGGGFGGGGASGGW
ncbi:MAG: TPM domain-containing protein [Thalassolituus sp.]